MFWILMVLPATPVVLAVAASADEGVGETDAASQEFVNQQPAAVERHFRLFAVRTDLQRLLTQENARAYLVFDASSVLKDGKLDVDSPVWESIGRALRSDQLPALDKGCLVYQCYFQRGGDQERNSTAILGQLADVINDAGIEGVSLGMHFGDDAWADWINAASVIDKEEKDEPAIGEEGVKVCPVNTTLGRLLLQTGRPPDCYVSVDLRKHENATGIPPELLDEIIQLVPQLTLKRKHEICFQLRGTVKEFANQSSSLEKLAMPAALPRDLGFETWSLRQTLGPNP